MRLHAVLLPVFLATACAVPVMAETIPATVAAAVKDPARPATDTARDDIRKPAESLAFAGIKPGDKILELFGSGGYYTRLLAKTVGPKGHIYTTANATALATRPTAADALKAVVADPAYSNITMLTQTPAEPTAPEPVDMVWTSENYHDVHNPGNFSAGDILAFNKKLFAALKPGGTYIVIDYAAAPGSGTGATATLHRIDPEAAKQEITAAGFTFVGSSDILHRTPADDLTTHSSEKSEEFVFKFKKP